MLRRETGKKRSVYWTYIDCFLAGFTAQHTGKAAFEQMMTRPILTLFFRANLFRVLFSNETLLKADLGLCVANGVMDCG